MLGRTALISAMAAMCLALAATGLRADPQKVAFFGLVLIDTSPGEPDPKAETRLRAMETRLVDGMISSGRYEFVDTAPVASKTGLYDNLAHCNGCDSRLAAALGADVALSGEVQKTSNLILSVSIYMRDAETGALIGGGSADMRGNTDESWSRAIPYILKNRILK